jgi:Domain of unknown function (DUF4893)
MNRYTRVCTALLLGAVGTAAQAADPRLQQVWPEHQARLGDVSALVAQVNGAKDIPASDADAKAVAEELLAEPQLPLDAAALKGDWKVRSIQGGRYGIYAYPWFKARVTEREGKLFFEKLTGSQRRSGWLLPPQGQGSWILLGGATVNEDPQVAYSREAGAQMAQSSDTVGQVWGIAEGRVLMLLDASADGYEIYQLKR